MRIRRPTYQPLLVAVIISVLPFIMTLILAPSRNADIGVLTHGIVCVLPHVILGLCIAIGIILRELRVTALSLFWMALYTYLSLPLPFEFLDLDPLYRGELISTTVPLSLLAFMLVFDMTSVRRRNLKSIFLLVAIPSVGCWLWKAGLIPLTRDVPAESLFSGLPMAAILFAAIFGSAIMRVPVTAVRGFYLFQLMALIPIDYAATRLYFGSANFASLQVELSAAFVIVGALLAYGIHWMRWNGHYTDYLTGLPNRDAWKTEIHNERQFALALIDVDDLDSILHAYGPAEAQQVLRCIGAELKRTARRARVFRTGEKQFSVCAQGKEDFEIARIMEAAREAIEKRKFVIRKEEERKNRTRKDRAAASSDTSDLIPLSISVGVAANGTGRQISSERNVVGAASRALARARAAGKNRVYVDSLEPLFLGAHSK